MEQNISKLLLENEQLKDSLKKHKLILNLLSELNIAMSSATDVEELASFIIDKIIQIFKVKRASFMLVDEETGQLAIKAATGLDPIVKETTIKAGDPFSGWVVKEGNPLLVKDIDNEFPDLAKERLGRYNSKSFVILPIKIKDRTVGILNMTDKPEREIFNEDDLQVLGLFIYLISVHMESIKLYEKVKTMSALDALTELFNHRHFQERIGEEIYRAERYRHPLCVLLLDIDNFRRYNEINGYNAGDGVLKQVSTIIRDNTRQVDICSRFGPEEFAVILPDTNLKHAILVGDKLREKIASSVFVKRRDSALDMAKLTVSIGVVEHRTGLTKEELVHRMENALLEAKQKGKNRVSFYR
ncbi:MAG: sensor domain-containing diguanylate cyclase [Candidatus Omnitrophica bacterium]|nr:sensor domain-containing diguanylate cyclase [Candidatus Omnitrophota bacterium]MDD5654389.1 sensor domain-containing diguanylate cyclase [Candidatus Omnitrophota bacterium]